MWKRKGLVKVLIIVVALSTIVAGIIIRRNDRIKKQYCLDAYFLYGDLYKAGLTLLKADAYRVWDEWEGSSKVNEILSHNVIPKHYEAVAILKDAKRDVSSIHPYNHESEKQLSQVETLISDLAVTATKFADSMFQLSIAPLQDVIKSDPNKLNIGKLKTEYSHDLEEFRQSALELIMDCNAQFSKIIKQNRSLSEGPIMNFTRVNKVVNGVTFRVPTSKNNYFLFGIEAYPINTKRGNIAYNYLKDQLIDKIVLPMSVWRTENGNIVRLLNEERDDIELQMLSRGLVKLIENNGFQELAKEAVGVEMWRQYVEAENLAKVQKLGIWAE